MARLPRILRPAALLGLVLALPACGQVAYEDLSAEQTDALCEYLVRCGYATDEGLCASVWGVFSRQDPNLDAAVDNGSVEYDAKAAKECLESIRDAACDADFFLGDAPDEACEKVFQGTVDNGGACFIDEQCVSGTCHAADCDMACCQGTCIAPPPDAAIGQDCSAQDCVDGAYCHYDFEASTFTCLATKPAGAACDSGDDECAGSLACVGGTCQELPAEGAPCPTGRCAGALGCDVDTFTCQKLRGEGQACNQQASLCAIGLVCAASSTCQPPGGVGSPCTFDFIGGTCAGDAWCDYDFIEGKGTCQPLAANGAACEGGDFQCQSRYCGEDGLCAPEPICVQ